MAEFFSEYGLFLAKSVTVLLVFLVCVLALVQASAKGKSESSGHIEVKRLNDELEMMADSIKAGVLDKALLKKQHKDAKKEEKAKAKARAKQLKKGEDLKEEERPRVFVIDFAGDIKASEVDCMREEITAVLTLASEQDEIFVKLESAGGMVHAYGLAASQLERIKQKKIPLVVAVDRVAASGGYMMACLADKIIAAPFAVLGSIGVVAQLPNFHRLLKKNNIDFELLTAGEYKRTLTMFGENTEQGREKFIEELEDTHALFKDFVADHRPQVNIEEVANGEVWFGTRALDKKLVDEINTSDQYLMDRCKEADVYQIEYVMKRSLPERLGINMSAALDRVLLTWWDRIQKSRYFS